MLALYYVLIGFGNDNLSEIFSTFGVYILLVFAFVGPIIYSKIKRLE